MVAAGDSVATIARTLTNEHIPTPALVSHRPSADPSRGIWIPSVVRRLLANPIYFGAFAYGTNGRKGMSWRDVLALPPATTSIIDGRGPFFVRNYLEDPVVSEAEWIRANELMSGRDGNPRKRTSHVFLFSGLVRCAHCASAVTVTGRKVGDASYRYYKHTVSNRETRPCPNIRLSVRADELESHIEHVVLDALASTTLAEDVLQELQTTLRSYASGEEAQLTDALQRELGGVERQIRQTVRSLAELGLRPHVEREAREVLLELDANAAMLTHRIDTIREQGHRWSSAIELLSAARESRGGLLACYTQASYAAKKEMLHAVVDQILLDGVNQRAEVRLRPFAPSAPVRSSECA